jgi:hypothetical protein
MGKTGSTAFWHPRKGRTVCFCCRWLGRLIGVSEVLQHVDEIVLTDVGVDFTRACLVLESYLQSWHSARNSDSR